MKLEIKDVRLTDKRLRSLPERLRPEAQRIVERVAFWIEGQAKIKSPIDTGFLRNSIHTVTSRGGGSSLADARAAARSSLLSRQRSSGTSIGSREFQTISARPGELSAYVVVGAAYGAYLEYGTSRMAARPFLTPAFEAARPLWEEQLRKLFERAV